MGRNNNGIQNTLDIFLGLKIRASSIRPAFIGKVTLRERITGSLPDLESSTNWTEKLGSAGVTKCEDRND
ncbi:hypothetical protein CEXT_354081 [Caerostris extrusa]|uniref:Uncharacterized protein n=1 Tax=Caerostris extrusa TaxID=172846 RepID=A0AAV4PX77_CAEEX|nr:hypothetical protein CEXT_354081 [Caerostris extrusa]